MLSLIQQYKELTSEYKYRLTEERVFNYCRLTWKKKKFIRQSPKGFRETAQQLSLESNTKARNRKVTHFYCCLEIYFNNILLTQVQFLNLPFLLNISSFQSSSLISVFNFSPILPFKLASSNICSSLCKAGNFGTLEFTYCDCYQRKFS